MSGEFLDEVGVPRPDGTPLGDARHVLGVLRRLPDDYCVVVATRGVYDSDDVTGLSLGDLRFLVSYAELGLKTEQLVLGQVEDIS